MYTVSAVMLYFCLYLQNSLALERTKLNYATTLLSDLKVQQENGEHCDVILHVSDQQFYAHRCVLAANGTYFHNVFTQNQSNESQLSFPSTDPKVLKSVLEFIYSGTLSVSLADADELLTLCSTLEINKLRKVCYEALHEQLDISNWFEIRKLASKHNIPELTFSIVSHLADNFAFITDDKNVLDLDVKEMLIICKRCNINGDKDIETSRFQFIFNWISHDYESRERYYAEIMQTVNPDNLDSQTIHSFLAFHTIKGSNLCEHFVTHALIKFVSDRENFEHASTKVDLSKENDISLSEIPKGRCDSTVRDSEADTDKTVTDIEKVESLVENVGDNNVSIEVETQPVIHKETTSEMQKVPYEEHNGSPNNTDGKIKASKVIKDNRNFTSDEIELRETRRTRRTNPLKSTVTTETLTPLLKHTMGNKTNTKAKVAGKVKRGRPKKTLSAELPLPGMLEIPLDIEHKQYQGLDNKSVETMPDVTSHKRSKGVKWRIKQAKKKTSSTQTTTDESDDQPAIQFEIFPAIKRRPRSKKITSGKNPTLKPY